MNRSITAVSAAAFLFVTAAIGCQAAPERDTSIRVTFNDGQRLVGDMPTPSLTLKTALGVFAIDPAEIGELGPVEGDDLGESGAAVTVWLRDGSEYTGEWTNPDAAVQLEIGGETHTVSLPVDKLGRMQFTGDEIWPEGNVVRVITSSGDDFLVDAAATTMTIVNEFGTFNPTFDEIARLTPPERGEELWTVELTTGTILKGRMPQDELVVYPSLGPTRVAVPVLQLIEIRKERWEQQSIRGGVSGVWFSNDQFRAQKAGK